MNKRVQTIYYIATDAIAAAASYTLLFAFRKLFIESEVFGIKIPVRFDNYFYQSLIGYIVFWLLLYWSVGYYKDVFRKSRLKEFIQTIVQVSTGSIIIFFAFILDDTIVDYTSYYQSFITLILTHFTLTYFPRLVLTSRTTRKIHNREWGFNTVIIGSNEKAVEILDELNALKRSSGNRFVGFVSVDNNIEYLAKKMLSHLGSYNRIKEIIDENKIEEVIIAIETTEHNKLGAILNLLEETDVIIKVIPDTYDIISGKVRMNSIFGVPLIEITHELMPAWQFTLKRLFDIVASSIALLILSPLLLFIAIMVRLSSKGPIFYKQARIGLHRKEFHIIKFRSMYTDAESKGPQLSSKNDSRITPWGRIMRKFRLDELPQFWNVLRGDMSIVGPRPERQHFIDLIEQKAPHYRHLHKVRPGITSWGMVKYGYAENVEEMIQRMKYDILYIENMSLFIDLKILIYTVLIVVQGRGK